MTPMATNLKIITSTHRPVVVDYRGNSATVRPTITSRAVKPPKMRGHRTYLEVSK